MDTVEGVTGLLENAIRPRRIAFGAYNVDSSSVSISLRVFQIVDTSAAILSLARVH